MTEVTEKQSKQVPIHRTVRVPLLSFKNALMNCDFGNLNATDWPVPHHVEGASHPSQATGLFALFDVGASLREQVIGEFEQDIFQRHDMLDRFPRCLDFNEQMYFSEPIEELRIGDLPDGIDERLTPDLRSTQLSSRPPEPIVV